MSAVDEAGNEGDLSIESFATALIENNSNSGGLPVPLHGLVDAVIRQAEMVREDINSIKDSFYSKEGLEKELFSDLMLSRDIESALSELNALQKDISKYKSEYITQTELNKKLDSANLKISSIKKKVPETIIIGDSKEFKQQINLDDLRSLAIFSKEGISEDEIEYRSSKSLEAIKSSGFETTLKSTNLEIIYLDGSRAHRAVMKEKISSNNLDGSNFSIAESIGEEVISHSSEILLIHGDYKLIKEDTILSFSSDKKEIIYILPKNIDLKTIPKVKSILWYESAYIPKKSLISGYATLYNFDGTDFKKFFLFVLVILFLTGYYFYLRSNRSSTNDCVKFKEMVSKIKIHLKNGEVSLARNKYNELSSMYKSLPKNIQKGVYDEVQSILSEINSR